MSEQEATLDEFVDDEDTDGSRTSESNESSVHPRLGTIPPEWEIKEIADVAEVVGGSTPSTSNDAYWGGGIPWATPTDITGLSGNQIEETADTLTQEGLESASTHLLPPYSVLMTSRATIGECAVNTVEMATNQGFKSLIPKKGIETWYLHYRMLETAPFLESLGTGSTFDEVSKSVVQTVDIPIASFEEQRKIASVLYTVDEAIQETEEVINCLKKVREGTAQDIVYGHTKQQELKDTDSRFGRLPRHWEIRQLSDVVKIVSGSTPSTDEPKYWDGSIPWATPTDLTDLIGVEIDETADTITKEGLNATSTHILPPGSVLMTSRASIGKCAINRVEMATNQGFQSLVPSECMDTNYLYYLMKQEAPYLESLGSGSTFLEVSKRTVERITIPVPPIEEQERIGRTVRSIDQRILHEFNYRDSLQRLKQGLMQDLLSGTVRTTDTNIEVLPEVEQHG